jgi:hypothetical protein
MDMTFYRVNNADEIKRVLSSPYATDRIQNGRIERWPALLNYFRRSWLEGEETVLETGLIEYFEEQSPNVLPDWFYE